jgi:HEAT repeat protein
LAALIAAVILKTFFSVPTREEQVARALRDLRREVTAFDKVRTATWTRLPEILQNNCMRLLPEDAVQARQRACQELAELDADSKEVIEALKVALNDPMIAAPALMVLYKLGPRAEGALDRLLELRTTLATPRTAGWFYEALGAIAPTDERVLSLMISSLGATNGSAWAATAILTKYVRLYDEGVQARILAEVTRVPGHLTAVIPIVAAINPGSERTGALMLGFLRDDREAVKQTAVGTLSETGTANREIIRELIQMLESALRERTFEGPALQLRPSDRWPGHGPPVPGGQHLYWAGWHQLKTVIRALGRSSAAASQEAAPVIRQVMENQSNLILEEECAIALWRITGETEVLRKVFGPLLESPEQRARQVAISHLYSIAADCPDATALMARGLDDNDKTIRLQVVTLLGMLGEKARPHLIAIEELRNDSVESIRIKAGEVMRAMHNAEKDS